MSSPAEVSLLCVVDRAVPDVDRLVRIFRGPHDAYGVTLTLSPAEVERLVHALAADVPMAVARDRQERSTEAEYELISPRCGTGARALAEELIGQNDFTSCEAH